MRFWTYLRIIEFLFKIVLWTILTAIQEDELVEEPERREIIISNIERQKELLLITFLGQKMTFHVTPRKFLLVLGLTTPHTPLSLRIDNSKPDFSRGYILIDKLPIAFNNLDRWFSQVIIDRSLDFCGNYI
jgi:hypothetical protein